MTLQSLITRTRLVLTTFALLLIPTVSLAAPAVAYAESPQDQVCKGLGASGSGTNCSEGSGPTVMEVLRAIIRILSLIVGIAAVIMIVVAGLKYVTSAGDPSGVKSAKDTLIYAIVGLIVAALASAIVQFVLVKIE